MTNKLVVVINRLKYQNVTIWNEISCTKLQLPPEPLTRGLPPPDPRSLCPLCSTEFVEPPPPKKILGYATDRTVPEVLTALTVAELNHHSERYWFYITGKAPWKYNGKSLTDWRTYISTKSDHWRQLSNTACPTGETVHIISRPSDGDHHVRHRLSYWRNHVRTCQGRLTKSTICQTVRSYL